MRFFSRTLVTFLLTIVIGGLAVGACLAALIPGTVEIATAHHYTAGWSRAPTRCPSSRPSTGTTASTRCRWTARLRAPRPDHLVADVPPRSVNAVIATEDRSFWTNDGIDLGGVFRAFVTNVVSGDIVQGGSTITQQLVKKRILSDKRDVHRKIREISLALRLNEKFSKDKILAEYLNTVYFGANSYGIKSAAERFFTVRETRRVRSGSRGKTTRELTIGEAALLAGLINNPVGNNPFRYPENAHQRRADVLAARSRRATSPRPRPTPPTSSRCRPSAPPAEPPVQLPRRRGSGPAAADPRLGQHPKSGATSCSRAG